MLLGQAGPPSPGMRSMGRRRTINHDLPPRMARKGANYYYVCNAPRRWIPLGQDLARAKRRWAELDAPLQPATLTVACLVQRYIDREDRPHSTATQYASYLRCIAAAFPIPAAQLTSQHVALWRELPLQRARPAFVNGCLAILLAAYRLGAECGLCQPLTVGKCALRRRERILDHAEFRRIRERACDWLRLAMDLGYLTSLRPCDLRALRWDAITDRITVRQQKTGERQEYLLQGDIATVVVEARQRPILGLTVLVSERGRPITRSIWSAAWLAARTAAGVPDAQFRDVRSLAAIDAQAGGLDYQALLGHSSQRMSDRYLRGRKVTTAMPIARKL